MGTLFYKKYYMVLDQTPKAERGLNYIQIGLGHRSGADADINNQYAPTSNQVYPFIPESKDSSHSINGYPNVYPDPNPSPNVPVVPPVKPPLPTPTPDIPVTPSKPVNPSPKPLPNPSPVGPPTPDSNESGGKAVAA